MDLLPSTVCNCKLLCFLLLESYLCASLSVPASWVRNPNLVDFDIFKKGEFPGSKLRKNCPVHGIAAAVEASLATQS